MTDDPAVPSADPLVIFLPSGRRGRLAQGTTVLAAARALGVDLDSVCGGRGICSRCQVEPAFGDFPKHAIRSSREALSLWNEVEARYDRVRGLPAGRRLGCQARIEGDVVIDVPPTSQVHRQVVRKTADARAVTMDPATRLHFVEVAEPDMHEPAGDFERLAAALSAEWGVEGLVAAPTVLAGLQRTLRRGAWRATAAVWQDGEAAPRLLGLWPGFREAPIAGLAVDVGSTTIAAHLCDLATGAVLASAGTMNPQIRFGEDLMSRVGYAMMTEGGAAEMTRAVRGAIDALARELLAAAGLEPDALLEGVFVGNPVMHHLLLGLDPSELGQAPFALATAGATRMEAGALGFAALPAQAQVYILPCIAGHVGADAAAVALAVAPQDGEALTLVVDVGTNAEILLGNRERLLACSSPTGPAFEGAQISAGQRAAPGAIERVAIDPITKRARIRVIGCDLWSDEPGFAEATAATGVTGLCGSGIIEAVAEMRVAGLLDASGLIGSAEDTGSERILPSGRTFDYLLWPGEPEIRVTQGDIRAIQLAKAALYAGARLLMDEFAVDRVDRVVLAGAFGAHISPRHAMILGMIPDCPLGAVSSAGNAAGSGARIALLDRGARRAVEALARRIVKVETAIEPRFQEHFVAANALPHATAPFDELRRIVPLPEPAFGGQARRRRARPPA